MQADFNSNLRWVCLNPWPLSRCTTFCSLWIDLLLWNEKTIMRGKAKTRLNAHITAATVVNYFLKTAGVCGILPITPLIPVVADKILLNQFCEGLWPGTGSPMSNEDKWSDRASWQHLNDISYTSEDTEYIPDLQRTASPKHTYVHRLLHMLFYHNIKAYLQRWFEGKKRSELHYPSILFKNEK